MNHIHYALVLASLLSLAATNAHPGDIEVLTTPEHEARNYPFSQAVVAGDLIFLSGQLGTPPGSGQVVSGGIEAETKQTMQNIKATLERYGSSMDNVAKCTVFLADMAEWSRMNSVYVTFFPNHKPARSALGASGLALGARVEIECIAAK